MKLLLFFISYLIGSISWAIAIGKLYFHKDIRDFGSGNAGATNVLRSFGKRMAFVTFILDFFKGFIPTLIGYRLFGLEGVLYSGLGVVVGHNWPIYFGFKGGKGISTSFGVFMAYKPTYALALVVVFTIVVSLSKMVSLGSIGGALTSITIGIIEISEKKYPTGILLILLGLIAIYKHRSNIDRILKGKESKLGKK